MLNTLTLLEFLFCFLYLLILLFFIYINCIFCYLIKYSIVVEYMHMNTTIDQVISEKLNNWVVDGWPVGNLILCVIALLLATLLCGAVGIEREKRGRTAGLRTHLLVGVGSCLIMIISIYGFPATAGNRDVARLAAQIITGVGFLGAGAIIHRNSGTKGLTTAATIWIVMAIGLACGSMNFILAIGGTILILIVLTFFRKFETRITNKTPLILLIADSHTPIISNILEVAQKEQCTINDFQCELLDDGTTQITFFAIASSSEFDSFEFIAKIEQIEGVKQVGTLNAHKS